MKHIILSLNAGYSLHSLMQSNPNLSAQFELLGIDCKREVAVADRNQLITQISQSVKNNRLILILDNEPQIRAREILAQGFNKPLHQDAKALQNISEYFTRAGRMADQELLKDAMIPKDAVALSEAGCPFAGFAMFYPTCCIALVPGTGATALRLIVNHLYPLLLKNLYPGAVMTDVPIREECVQDVQEYLERVKRRNPDFLPMLGGTSARPVLRLIAVKESRSQSAQCCNSFLEDLVSECGNVTTISGVGMKGIQAVEKNRKKINETLDFTNSRQFAASSKVNPTPAVLASTNFPKGSSSSLYLLDDDIDLDDDILSDIEYEDDEELQEVSKSYHPKKAKKKQNNKRSKQQQWADDDVVAEKRSPIITLLLIVFIVVFLGSVGYLGQYYWKSAQNRTAYQSLRDVYNQTTLIAPQGYPKGYDKDFAALWELNNDTVGWISIEGTDLDYPVVQTTDNTKYYRTNFEGEYSEHAVPFVDAQADLKKPSENLIIYGHNIRTDGQMFNILKGYTKLDFYQQHPVIDFNSVYHKGKYKIISVFYTNTLSDHGKIFPYHEFINAQSNQETQNYIDDVLVRSIINTGVDVLPSDELLTLSTCTYEFKDARYVVVARKVRKGENDSVDTSKAQMNPNPLYPDVWYQLFGGTRPDESQLKANLPH